MTSPYPISQAIMKKFGICRQGAARDHKIRMTIEAVFEKASHYILATGFPFLLMESYPACFQRLSTTQCLGFLGGWNSPNLLCQFLRSCHQRLGRMKRMFHTWIHLMTSSGPNADNLFANGSFDLEKNMRYPPPQALSFVRFICINYDKL